MKPWLQKNFNAGMHLLVWALLYFIPLLLVPHKSFLGLPPGFFPITTLFHIGLFYLNAYLLYPRLLNKKLWWLYIIGLAALVILSYFTKLYFLSFVPDFKLTHENRGAILFGVLPFLIASIIFRLISDRIRFERLEKEARTEQLASELKFLRSQVSPHFLFNMMTNMVSLARKQSDMLEPSLIKLSELLRYMLYDSQKDKISIGDEIEHLNNYIALQKLRFDEEVKVEVNIEDECPDCLIEPMLLIPFIENAFKHGIGMQDNAFISIHLTVKEKQLQFSISNNYNKSDFSKDKSSGIGLLNVKNRLKLLYPDNYELHITNDDRQGIFSVHLNLNL